MHCLFPFFVVYERMTILAEEGFPILLLLFIRFITRIFLAFDSESLKCTTPAGPKSYSRALFPFFIWKSETMWIIFAPFPVFV